MLFAYNVILKHIYFNVYIMLDIFIFFHSTTCFHMQTHSIHLPYSFICDLIRTCMLLMFSLFIYCILSLMGTIIYQKNLKIYVIYCTPNYFYMLQAFYFVCTLIDINIMLGAFINQLFDGVYLLIVNKQIKNMYSMKKKCDFCIKKLNN